LAELDVRRLIGEDGKLETYTDIDPATSTKVNEVTAVAGKLGAAGNALPSSGFAIVTGKGTASGFGELQIGDVYWHRNTVAANQITLVVGDKYQPIFLKTLATIVSFDIQITRTEIDVTAMNDTLKLYRYGRAEWTGSIVGIRDLVFSNDPMTRAFARQIEWTAGGNAPEVIEQQDIPLAMFGWLQKNEVSDWSRAFVHLPVIEIGGAGIGAVDGQRQEFTTPFRIGAGGPRTLAVHKFVD
jgi:hypothetical protein